MLTVSLFQKMYKRLGLLVVWATLAPIFALQPPASLVQQALDNPKQLAFLDISRTPGLPPFVRDFLIWLKAQHAPEELTFAQLKRFLDTHTNWPRRRLIQLAAESQLERAPTSGEVLAFFQKYAPLTAKGHLAYLKALAKANQTRSLRSVAQETWIKTSLSPSDQQIFLSSFKQYLKPIHHVARLEDMLWNRETKQAKQTLAFVREPKQRQARAWIAFLEGSPGAMATYQALPSNLRQHEGLDWAKVLWLKKNKRHGEATQLILTQTHGMSRPAIWWHERNYLAREMLQAGKPKLAYQLVTQHRMPGTFVKAYAEAEWFAGWLALRFLNQPQTAKKHFERFRQVVKTPISLARAGYWMGRAHEALKQQEAARKAYTQAAHHKTTFYGQLASLKVNQSPFPRFKDVPQAPDRARKSFEERALVKLVRFLRDLGPKADPFIREIFESMARHAHASSDKQLLVALAGEVMPSLAAEMDRQTLDHSGVVLKTAYPILPLPSQTAKPEPEHALVMAVIHRETRFNPDSLGGAGERGLMQIMPHTAKMEADDLGIKHHPDKLFDSPYNIRLGMAHLTRHLKRFNNVYVLGVAAYNAGDSAVARWVASMGLPHKSKLDVVDWIESIPYTVTRDYVQRVLENLTIYRARLGKTDHTLSHVLQAKHPPLKKS